MIAIGNNELGNPLGKTIKCPHCNKRHQIENSGPSKTYHHDGTVTEGPSGHLQFYKCGDKTYLAGIEGRAIRNRSNT